jgi:ribosomal protein S14
MERVHDDYRSYKAQGDCYRYIHRCHKCGTVIFEMTDYEYREHPERVKMPNYCQHCGTKQ